MSKQVLTFFFVMTTFGILSSCSGSGLEAKYGGVEGVSSKAEDVRVSVCPTCPLLPGDTTKSLSNLMESEIDPHRKELMEIMMNMVAASDSRNPSGLPGYFFTYREALSGRIIDGAYSLITGTYVVRVRVESPANPVFETAKERDGRILGFLSNSICVGQMCPSLNATDVAHQTGDNYVLLSGGRVLRSNGQVVREDPSLSSIAFSQGVWHLLHSDGSFSLTLNIGSAGVKVDGLVIPNALNLVMGQGQVL